MIYISKKNRVRSKTIFKGSWWYNNKRKHPSIVIKSNNKDYFEIRLLSHEKYNGNDFILKISPNPNGDSQQQFINSKKYVEYSIKPFGRQLKNYKFSDLDKRNFKKWRKK